MERLSTEVTVSAAMHRAVCVGGRAKNCPHN